MGGSVRKLMAGAGQAPFAAFEPGAQSTGVAAISHWADANRDAVWDPVGSAWLHDDHRS
jgi:hypothetical protein